ncbi:sodium- and chloride-dependent glycine transporter 1-like [Lineus longissimus]|uniref:sodium- and chloride-dependent glycine transporter 1-like n=1 Tax=Lineus longissimus TaxID=88925 RepID=UPI00315D293A
MSESDSVFDPASPGVRNPLISIEGSGPQPGTGHKHPDTPGLQKQFDLLGVDQEEARRLSAIGEEDDEADEDEPLLEDLPRKEAVLSNALRRSSSVTKEPEPRRFSINARRRGSFGMGVFASPEPPSQRRPSLVVQEIRRRSSALPLVEEDEEKQRRPSVRRDSLMVKEVRRRSTLVTPRFVPEEEEPPKSVEEKEEFDVEKDEEKGAEEPKRAAWGGQLEFILTCIGYAVGLGNVWRFPYLCYKNGGGAFLVPYIIMLAVVGLPLFYLELAFGQFASLGPITIWRISPPLKGLGYSMVIASWLISLYYNVIIAHVLLYFFMSMTSVLPWTTCDNYWNTDACRMPPSKNDTLNATMTNGTFLSAASSINATVATNLTKTPSEEYYYNYILEQSSGIEEFGLPSWKLLLTLLLAWVIVLAVLLKGIESLGKVVYFTAIFPYVMLTVLLIRGVTLPGADQGILYYLKPDFSRLADARVWSDAATQIFYSLGACSGGLIAMSSYNKFDNNCVRDSLIVAIINCATSIFAGLVIFSVLGFMAAEKGVDVGDVATGGPGLAFVVYPEAIAKMPVAPLWAILFFIMMATLGFGSQFSMMESVLSAFSDEFSSFITGPKQAIIFRCSVIALSFLLGIPMICKGGIYLLNLVDYCVSGFPFLFAGFFELVAISWIYGFKRFAEDIEMMLGKKPNIYWKACWMVISPLVIVVTIIFNCVLYKPPSLDGYSYPAWADGIGWLTALWLILMVPGWFIYQYGKDGGYDLLKEAVKPRIEWGPALSENRQEAYLDIDGSEGNKSTIFATRENKTAIVVCTSKNRQQRNGSAKGQSSFGPKDGTEDIDEAGDTCV